jgi:hypothetical protein
LIRRKASSALRGWTGIGLPVDVTLLPAAIMTRPAANVDLGPRRLAGEVGVQPVPAVDDGVIARCALQQAGDQQYRTDARDAEPANGPRGYLEGPRRSHGRPSNRK